LGVIVYDSGKRVWSIIPPICGFLLEGGTYQIEGLIDWKSGIIEGREGSRYELNQSKGLPSGLLR